MNEMTNSHILVQAFSYSEPSNLKEAVSLLSNLGSKARVVAGGTDLLVQMKMERLNPIHLVSLRSIPGLSEISISKAGLRIGACASIRSLSRDEIVRRYFPALAEGCASFSTTQIQIMGTLGGNLCNASPASDTAPALLAYLAKVKLLGPDGERELPLDEFFVAPGVSALGPGEIMTSVFLPWPDAGTGAAFMKVSRVAADIAKVSAAAIIVRNDTQIVDCRIAFGSVAPTPIRAFQAEALLTGQVFSDDLGSAATQSAAEGVEPIDDVRSSAEYRREVVRVLAFDTLAKAWDRAAPGAPEPPQRGFSKPSTDSVKSSNGHFFKMPADERIRMELKVNGSDRAVWVAPNDLLLNVLREQLQLTGTKYACGIGECSACTVEIDGQPALACLVLAAAARNSEITTIEGLQAPNGQLHPLQQAFIDEAGFQCGYCTPGVLMTAKGLLSETPEPEEQEVRNYLKGNLCRCTGYASIIRAVMSCTGVQEASTKSL